MVFVATDAPSHARHCIEVLKHGKHVCCAVPAAFGNLEEAEELYKTVKETGLNYQMMETSSFHDDLLTRATLACASSAKVERGATAATKSGVEEVPLP